MPGPQPPEDDFEFFEFAGKEGCGASAFLRFSGIRISTTETRRSRREMPIGKTLIAVRMLHFQQRFGAFSVLSVSPWWNLFFGAWQ
jgi:hypothetical protein